MIQCMELHALYRCTDMLLVAFLYVNFFEKLAMVTKRGAILLGEWCLGDLDLFAKVPVGVSQLVSI